MGEPDVAYVEHSLGSVIFQKEHDVRRARLSFQQLRSAALSPEQSLELIRRAADQIWAGAAWT